MTIAQVQVDDAYWTFTQDPPGRLARLATAWIHVPFPWVLGEAHEVKVVTKTGATFEHEIAVAVPTPKAHAEPASAAGAGRRIRRHPAGRDRADVLSRRCAASAAQGMSFLLALTVGLLPSCSSTARRMRSSSPASGGRVPRARDGGARRRREFPRALGDRPPARRADRAGARDLHRARHRPAQSRRRPRDRRRLRGRRSRARHVPRARLYPSQHHRGHRHRCADR